MSPTLDTVSTRLELPPPNACPAGLPPSRSRRQSVGVSCRSTSSQRSPEVPTTTTVSPSHTRGSPGVATSPAAAGTPGAASEPSSRVLSA